MGQKFYVEKGNLCDNLGTLLIQANVFYSLPQRIFKYQNVKKKTESLKAINYRKMKSLIYVGKKVALCQCSNLFFILYFSLFFKEYQFNIMSQTYNNVRISNSLFSPVLQYTSRICSGFYYHFEKYFFITFGVEIAIS